MSPGASAASVSSSQPDLELSAVSKRFGDVTALDALSLTIEHGEFVTLLGPSGCGKTTTLRIVAGLEYQTGGSVRIRGEVVDGVPPYRRNVNTVFQNYALFPHLTVSDNVGFGLRVKRLPAPEIRQRVGLALEQVRLSGFERRRPHELSGGQQQRIALARALVNQPAILLLDEPLGALDLKLRREMQLELRRVHREVGFTFIYVTHDQEEALTMSDRIAVMNAARLVQIGSPKDIYQRPRTTFVANFVGVSNFLDGVIGDRNGGAATVALAGGWRFRRPFDEQPASDQKVRVAVRPEKVRISDAPTGMPGKVDDVIYLGSRVTLVVRLSDGEVIHVEDPAAVAKEGTFSVGQPIHVDWDGGDCLVFDHASGQLVS